MGLRWLCVVLGWPGMVMMESWLALRFFLEYVLLVCREMLEIEKIM